MRALVFCITRMNRRLVLREVAVALQVSSDRHDQNPKISPMGRIWGPAELMIKAAR
ncbi:MAG: hypothetical protein Ct9H300mP13_6460 [Gammaproteobacteria bacterium]|nr:MAG: hypothetical protein Ct9H300mP13_6460 [Gammaproteobacteria bacterium]